MEEWYISTLYKINNENIIIISSWLDSQTIFKHIQEYLNTIINENKNKIISTKSNFFFSFLFFFLQSPTFFLQSLQKNPKYLQYLQKNQNIRNICNIRKIFAKKKPKILENC